MQVALTSTCACTNVDNQAPTENAAHSTALHAWLRLHKRLFLQLAALTCCIGLYALLGY